MPQPRATAIRPGGFEPRPSAQKAALRRAALAQRCGLTRDRGQVRAGARANALLEVGAKEGGHGAQSDDEWWAISGRLREAVEGYLMSRSSRARLTASARVWTPSFW